MEKELHYSGIQEVDSKINAVPCSMCSGTHEQHIPNCPNDYTVFAMLLKDSEDADLQRF